MLYYKILYDKINKNKIYCHVMRENYDIYNWNNNSYINVCDNWNI